MNSVALVVILYHLAKAFIFGMGGAISQLCNSVGRVNLEYSFIWH